MKVLVFIKSYDMSGLLLFKVACLFRKLSLTSLHSIFYNIKHLNQKNDSA